MYFCRVTLTRNEMDSIVFLYKSLKENKNHCIILLEELI